MLVLGLFSVALSGVKGFFLSSFVQHSCIFTCILKMTVFALPPLASLGFCSIYETDQESEWGSILFPHWWLISSSMSEPPLGALSALPYYLSIFLISKEWRSTEKRLCVCKFLLDLGLPEIQYCHASPHLTSEIHWFFFFYFLFFVFTCVVDNASFSCAVPQVRKSLRSISPGQGLPLFGIQAISLPWNFHNLMDSIKALPL